MGPEPAAPAVVAVIVASGHGPWLDEAFGSVAAQDYPNLSVLVAEVGTDAALAERVAELLPDAHFTRMPAGTGFAEAANQALEMVEGVAHVLVCHDDVALEKDAVWHLVEEAYRSNAGLTCPKFVLWDAPDRLLSVGLGADHLGVVHPLVEPGELDQGQRDSVREVFVAPTGAVLVRTDLWRALGGFAAGATGPGGDLDLSWRAHLAGARVVVAPQARARHLEAGPKGFCHSYGAGSPAARSQATNASEQTRLRVLWTCYGAVFVLLVAPVALFFAFAESGWALFHRRPVHEVLASLRAFALSLSRPRSLWAGRRQAQGLRRTSDFAVLKLQSRGSARLRALVRPRLEKGHQLAWAATRATGSSFPTAAVPASAKMSTPATAMAAGPAPVPLPATALSTAATIGLGTSYDLNGAPRPGDGSPPAGASGVAGVAGVAGPASLFGPASISGDAGMASVTDPSGFGPRSSAGQVAGSRGGAGPAPGARARQNWHENGEVPQNGEVLPNGQVPKSGEVVVSEEGVAIRPRADWRMGALTAVIVGALLLFGSRNYLSQPLPLVGQLPSVSDGVGSWWHDWWSGAGPGSLGTSSFAPPGLFFMGLIGAVSFGSANLAVHLLVLAPLALGPFGVYMATRAFGSQRGRLAATVVYAALPVAYNALSQGHWAGVIGYAAAPWLLGALCRLGGQAPYPRLRWGGAWARFIALGLLVAVATSLAPATLLLVPIVGCALFVGSLLTGRGRGGARFLFASLMASGVTFLALAPWSFAAFRTFDAFFELAGVPVGPLSVSSVLRLDTGSYGGGALGWAVLAAAAVPLFIGRSWRMAWAARLWVVAFTCLGLVWAGSRGWFPMPTLELVLAPAGAALAFSVAVGAASIEVDLSGYRFGWRQFAPAFGVLAVVAAAVPFLSWTGVGQWGLPGSAAEASYAFPAGSQGGDYRVLWVGSPGSLPLAAQGSSSGLAFATSLDGLPSASQLWGPEDSGRASLVTQDLGFAEDNETTSLGHLLAPLAVRYVVVPVGAGAGNAAVTDVVSALGRQVDLTPVGTDPSYAVFANASWAPLFAEVKANVNLIANPQIWPMSVRLQRLSVPTDEPVHVGISNRFTFDVAPRAPAMQVYASVPSGSWRLQADGHAVASRTALGWASYWALPPATSAVVLSEAGSPAQHSADILMVVVWALALTAAFIWMRRRLGAQLTMASVDFSVPGSRVSEIDWTDVWEEQPVG